MELKKYYDLKKLEICTCSFAKDFKNTERKIQGFSLPQILREINFGYYRDAKFANLTRLEALNFDI